MTLLCLQSTVDPQPASQPHRWRECVVINKSTELSTTRCLIILQASALQTIYCATLPNCSCLSAFSTVLELLALFGVAFLLLFEGQRQFQAKYIILPQVYTSESFMEEQTP